MYYDIGSGCSSPYRVASHTTVWEVCGTNEVAGRGVYVFLLSGHIQSIIPTVDSGRHCVDKAGAGHRMGMD